MGKKKILFASQEISPYLPETYMSNVGLNLPKHSIEQGNETRVFLPKFGVIKEKANNLHEVIRLSGMNLIIDDFDQNQKKVKSYVLILFIGNKYEKKCR